MSHAKEKGDDALFRRLLPGERVASQRARDEASEVAILLRKRRLEQQAADAKRRRAVQREERLAADDSEKLKALTAQAQAKLAETRLQVMQATIRNRRDQTAKTEQAAADAARSRWLQTQFPVEALRRVMRWHDKMDRKLFGKQMTEEIEKRTFERVLSNCSIPALVGH